MNTRPEYCVPRQAPTCRCRANMAHTRHSMPDSGLGFQAKVLKLSLSPRQRTEILQFPLIFHFVRCTRRTQTQLGSLMTHAAFNHHLLHHLNHLCSFIFPCSFIYLFFSARRVGFVRWATGWTRASGTDRLRAPHRFLRLIDFVHHSTLGMRVKKKKKKKRSPRRFRAKREHLVRF